MSRVVVVGTGIAGLIAALQASHRNEVVLVTKSDLSESNTRYAQGGIAAALFDDDSVASHVADTLVAGAGLNDRHAVEVLCSEGPERVRDLIALGVQFDRQANGELSRGHEAAHSHRRVIHAMGDATGLAIELALVAAVRGIAVEIHEQTFMRDLVVHGGRVAGVAAMCGDRSFEIGADFVILASGGAGQLYRHTTNPAVATGDGVAAALRAGAVVSDVEFYQFHPTSLAVPGNPLISEAVRGEGAVLLSTSGERFMTAVHPDAELAPRDVVARGIASQMAEQNGEPVLLDATALGGSFLAARFPGITASTRAHGFDWSIEPIPVTPAAHYWMGGVATDDAGRTTLPGLLAVGEVSCTGVHGANRLASNSLLESLVFAWRAAAALDQPWTPFAGPAVPASGPPASAGLAVARAAVSEIQDYRTVSGAPVSAEGREAVASPEFPPAARAFERAELQQLMWDHVGVYRSAPGLRAAAAQLATWRASGDDVAALEDRNLLDIARVIVAAALEREESRGAHFRSDFPATSPAFLRHLALVETHAETPAPEKVDA